MNPFTDSLADVQNVPAHLRVKALMEKQEAAEERQREVARYEREAQAEGTRMNTIARQRMERITQGCTSEELASYNAEREERARIEIEQLEKRLAQLDPARARVQRQQAQQIQIDATLRRSYEAAERGYAAISRVRQQSGQPVVARNDPRPALCEQCRSAGATRSEEERIHRDLVLTGGSGMLVR